MIDLFSTHIAYAAGPTLNTFMGNVDTMIINPGIKLLFGVGIGFFCWGCAEFFLKSDDEEAKTTGKNHMLWGLVGLVIMMAVWTIFSIIVNTLNVKGIQLNPVDVHLSR